ncbi:MAG: neutral/alkaline non-lysosomal ceramidase N-terminal domain-containing protein [Candidatus Bathyarchaeia archaeon]|nr:neutral/alkaline non-lysosomal ceramidase N-terminal domain-containing protein [Candidatus Bathyarchaeota archaeon]
MLEAGASRVRITPPIGVPMDGYASRDKPSQGIHDHLYARCLTLYDGKHCLALVSTDLLYITRDITEKVRETISRELGFPREYVAVVAVHNHSGPSVVGFHTTLQYGFLNEYLGLLPGLISSGLIKAFNSRRSVKVGYGKGEVKGWTINRRKTTTGRVDEELIAVRFENDKGQLISALVNYTCHAVVLGANNFMISGDYPGYVSRTVENTEGGVCLFLNGAFGDINPLTSKTIIDKVYDRTTGRFEDAVRMGRAIGGEALKILNSTVCREELPMSLASRRIKLKLKSIPSVSDEDIIALATKLKAASGRDAEDIKFKLLSSRFYNLIRTQFPSHIAEVEIQGFRIGDFLAILLPGEIFVDLGLMIKSYSQADVTMVIGCANELLGYVPTEDAFDEGGYEVNLPVCIVERYAGKLLVEAAQGVIDELLK